MKLKYYLRGLGIGIIGTAIVMGIALAGNKKEALSDEEIIERAEVLGMVMEGELGPDKRGPEGENPDGQEPAAGPEGQPGGEGEGDGSQEGAGEPVDPELDKDADGGSADSGKVQQPSSGAGDVVELEIKEGEFSDVISKKLFQAGLIPDADKFNAYMTQKGVDDSLRIGVHLIPAGSSADEIIDILKEKPQ